MRARRTRIRRQALPLGLALLALLAAAAEARAEAQPQASLTPGSVYPGQVVSLSIDLKASGLGEMGFTPRYTLENLERVGGGVRSGGFTFDGRSLRRSLTLSLPLRALGPGPAAVRNLRLVLEDGREIPLPDQEITVEAGSPPAAEDPRALLDRWFGGGAPRPRGLPNPFSRGALEQPAAIFLRGEVEPGGPYVGQQVLYRLVLYSRLASDMMNLEQLPGFPGFWVRDLPQPRMRPQETIEIGGMSYKRTVVLKKAIFPRRPGRFPVEPATLGVVVQEPSQFFGSAIVRPRPVVLSSLPVFIDVQPLPEPPPGWSGAVGQLALTAAVEPREARVGENVQIRLELAGNGQLSGIPSPAKPDVPGLTVYPPEQISEEKSEGEQIVGKRTWTYVAVPEQAGRFEVKLPEVSYFNPETARYEVARAAAMTVNVQPRPTPPPVSLAKAEAGTAQPEAKKIPTGVLLAGLAVLPWGIALLVYATRKQRERSRRELPSCPLRTRLESVRQEEKPRQAAARLEEIVGSLLAERLNLPALLPASHWQEELASHGVGAQGAAEAARLAEEINYLRHAPQLSATDDLRNDAIERALRLAARLGPR